jgi:hypothetical protein
MPNAGGVPPQMDDLLKAGTVKRGRVETETVALVSRSVNYGSVSVFWLL